MSIASKLKYARNHLGKTQEEMAKAIGKTRVGWQAYEKGSAIPGGGVFEELSKLGFNITWFFRDDVPMLLDEMPMQPAAGNETAIAVHETANAAPLPSDNLGLGESVELLAKIYNSGNKVLIRAIAANLSAFSEAIDNKALAQKAITMMDEMNRRMLALENDLAKLKEENEGLRKDPPGNSQQATG